MLAAFYPVLAAFYPVLAAFIAMLAAFLAMLAAFLDSEFFSHLRKEFFSTHHLMQCKMHTATES